jgi:methane/ammonia monooxygenase subunit A
MAVTPSIRARNEPAVTNPADIRRIYRWFDLIIVVLLLFLFMGLYHLVIILTVGDWDFWTDWKDSRWWLSFTPLVAIAMPASITYIFWSKFRLPFAATLLTFALVLAEWINRICNMHGWAYFPLNFVWPATLIPCGLALDTTLVLTESFLFTGIVGGLLWAVLFYLCNWPLITRFLLPVNVNGVLMSLADLQGFHYVRTGTPEYLRIINHGTLRTFGQDPIYLSIAFAGFISMIVYMLFLSVGWAFTKTQFSWLRRI